MGTFSPAESTLIEVREGTEFSFTITYEDGGIPYPVTITESVPNEAIKITGDTISGFFRLPFDDKITYKNIENNSFATVGRFRSVPKKHREFVVKFDPDLSQTMTFEYTATANGETKVYNIVVINKFEPNRSRLMSYVNQGAYSEVVATWTNFQGRTVKWRNRWNEVTDWIEEPWPWL